MSKPENRADQTLATMHEPIETRKLSLAKIVVVVAHSIDMHFKKVWAINDWEESKLYIQKIKL